MAAPLGELEFFIGTFGSLLGVLGMCALAFIRLYTFRLQAMTEQAILKIIEQTYLRRDMAAVYFKMAGVEMKQ